MRERLDVVDEHIMLALQEKPQMLGDLSGLTELRYVTLRQRLAKLQKYGYLAKPKYGQYALTDKGKRFVEGLSISVTPNLKDQNLKRAIDLLPTELHQAFFRLLISAIVGKHLLFEIYDAGYPAFIIGGSTKAFKTALAGVICRLFSLEESKHVILVPSLAPGEVWGRRVIVKGASYDINESPHFQKPWLCFDEFDKAPSQDVKRGIFLFLDGRREFEVEGQIIVNHAIAMVTLNTNPTEGLKRLGIPEAYIRRGITIDTDFVKSELGDVDLAAKEIFALKDFPKLSLKRLMLTQNKLEGEEFKLLRKLLMEHTLEEFKGLVDTWPLEILALGCGALLNGDVREAIYQTIWDRLICLESLGGTVAGWRESIGKEWAKYKREEQPEIEEQLREAAEKRRRRDEALEERKRELAQKSLEQEKSKYHFLFQRENLIVAIKAQVQKHKAKHPALAKPLATLWRDVKKKVKTSEALERYNAIFEDFVAQKVKPILEQEEKQRKELEAREAQRQEEKREKDTQIKLRAAELKDKIKVIDYYLGRKRVNAKEDIVLILQSLGVIKISDRPYYRLEKGRWIPDYAFVDVTGRIHRAAEVRKWTSWQAVSHLLRYAKQSLSKSTTSSLFSGDDAGRGKTISPPKEVVKTSSGDPIRDWMDEHYPS